MLCGHPWKEPALLYSTVVTASRLSISKRYGTATLLYCNLNQWLEHEPNSQTQKERPQKERVLEVVSLRAFRLYE